MKILLRCLESHVRYQVRGALGIKEVLSHDKYLEFPTVFFCSKKFSFVGLLNRWKKLQGLKEKLHSKAGKEILITEVAQSISDLCYKLF